MKKLILSCAILCIVALMTGCQTTQGLQAPGTIFDQDPATCTIYADFNATPENSLIAANIPNPCTAKSLITTASKLPALQWEKAYTVEFVKWANKLKAVIHDGITYRALQDLVLIEVSKINAKLGMGLLIVSDGIFVFNDEDAIMLPVDVSMINALIDHLVAEVQRLEIMMG